MKKLILVPFLILSFISLRAQELKCDVKIIAPKLQLADPAIFRTLETAIFEFLNNRKWTDDIFLEQERIECSLTLTITEELSSDRFKANANIQSSRPVFNSDYK